MRVLIPLFLILFLASPLSGAPDRPPLVRLEPAVAVKDVPPLAEGAPMALHFWRDRPAPGERWLTGRIVLPPGAEETIRATLFSPDGKAAGSAEAAAAGVGRVAVNLRDARWSPARLRVERIASGRVIAMEERLLYPADETPLAAGVRIPVKLDVATEFTPASTPVTFGVPFAPGQLWSMDGLQVCDAGGKPVPAQFEVSARWFEEGSIKWVRVDTVATAGGSLSVQYRPGAPVVAPPAPLRLEKKGSDWLVHVGKTQYLLSADHSPVRSISRDGQLLATSEGERGLYVVTQKGEVASASAEGASIVVESAGPLAACFRIEGAYRNGEGEVARHVTRVEFSAGDDRARVSHSFIVSQSTKRIWFREVGWDFRVHAGGSPRALFATSPAEWKAAQVVPLGSGESAYMVQDRHYRFLHGENHFEVGKSSGTRTGKLHEGEECGDWAALQGSGGGLLMACRETARRHPKEFAATPSGLTLLLFSPRAGRELDFTLESRVHDLNLRNLLDIAGKLTRHIGSDRSVEQFLSHENDALGWSKTHELVLAPVAPAPAAAEQLARPAAALSFPVYALADPAWIAASGAMGPIHPYDPKRFPKVEKVSEAYIAALQRFGEAFGEFGLIDYQAGPRFVQSMEPPVPLLRRNLLSYAMPDDLWYAYARRGQRSVREFAQGTSRFYLDSHMLHASGPNKTAGFFVRAHGEDSTASPTSLPVPWGGKSDVASTGSHSLERYLLDYYLTGNRRGRDATLAYGEAAKTFFTGPQRMKEIYRGLRFITCVLQAYSVGWDPALRDIADRAIDFMYRADGDLGLTLEKPYSTSYKTPSDLGGLIFAADLLREPRITEIRDKVVNFVRLGFGTPVFGYMDPSPWAASLLVEKGERYQAELMAMKLGQMGAEEPQYTPPFGHFAMHGFAIAQRVVVDAGAWQKPVAAFSGVETLNGGVSWLFPHTQGSGEAFYYRSETSESAPKSGNVRPMAGQRVRVLPVERTPAYGTDTLSVSFTSQGTGEFRVPMDMVSATYQVEAAEPGLHFLFADRRMPLVAYLPGAWRPMPRQSPPVPIFFKVPAGANEAELHLNGKGVLTTPSGTPFNGGKPVEGTVRLSGSDEGLWKLETSDAPVISGRGFPQLYAFGDPAFFFLPGEEAMRTVEENATGPVPLGGSGRRLDVEKKAVLGVGERLRVELPPGEPMPGGTVEFYYRFTGEVTALSSQSLLSLLGIHCEDDQMISLGYSAGAGRDPSYHLRVRFPAFDFKRDGTFGMFGERKFFPEKGRWYHIALSWGPSGNANLKREAGERAFAIRLFVDGEYGNQKAHAQVRRESRLVPLALTFGPGIPAEIAAVRVSRANRYTDDFQPPSPEELARPDHDTVAFFDPQKPQR